MTAFLFAQLIWVSNTMPPSNTYMLHIRPIFECQFWWRIPFQSKILLSGQCWIRSCLVFREGLDQCCAPNFQKIILFRPRKEIQAMISMSIESFLKVLVDSNSNRLLHWVGVGISSSVGRQLSSRARLAHPRLSAATSGSNKRILKSITQ